MWNILTKLSENKSYYIAVIILIILFTVMRGVFINADSSPDLTISAAIYTDEGFKIYASRNHVLYGNWKWTPEDEYEGWLNRGPLATYSYKWIFNKFGVSFKSIRFPSIIYAFFTMILLFVFLLRNTNKQTAILGLILFGIDFFGLMFNRLGFFETHLVFYLMFTLLGFSEAFKQSNNIPIDNSRNYYPVKLFLYRLFFIILGLAGITAGFFIKRSLLIIAFAIAPAALIYVCHRLNRTKKFIIRLCLIMLIALTLLYLLSTFMYFFQKFFMYHVLTTKIMGHPLSTFLPVFIFNPPHLVILNGFYLEFIFLHPFIFFTGIIYSIYTFYQFIFKDKKNVLDLFLSSWLLFGFLLLTIMTYHPARYYLLLIIPLIIITARAIMRIKEINLNNYINNKKPILHKILWIVFLTCPLIYSGTIILTHFMPFSIKNHLVQILYSAIFENKITSVLYIIIPIFIFEIFAITALILGRNKILGLIKNKNFHSILLTIIIIFHAFLYGKWFFFHKNNLYNTTKELGVELPEGSIIAGSWSAGLVIENKHKPLVMQTFIPYNRNLLESLLYNDGASLYSLSNGTTRKTYEKDIPVYFSICKNVIFERGHARQYKEHFVPENLIKKVQLGYFLVEIYKMNSYKHESNDIIEHLFENFL